MLVLTRKFAEKILIGDEIVLTIVRIRPGAVRIGIDAPKNLRVCREELPASIDVDLDEDEEIDVGELAALTGLGE